MKTFNFWKENKITNHFTLTEKELIAKYKIWLKTKEKEWLEYYSSRDCLAAFIAEKEGLNSVGNDFNNFKEYDEMEIILKSVRRTYLDKILVKL
jgi:hypothetical protein